VETRFERVSGISRRIHPMASGPVRDYGCVRMAANEFAA